MALGQGQDMTLTFNFQYSHTNIYQLSGHRVQYFLKYPLFSFFPIEKPSYQIWACRKIGQGHSRLIIVHIMMGRSPRLYIPSFFMEIGQPVAEKRFLKGF